LPAVVILLSLAENKEMGDKEVGVVALIANDGNALMVTREVIWPVLVVGSQRQLTTIVGVIQILGMASLHLADLGFASAAYFFQVAIPNMIGIVTRRMVHQTIHRDFRKKT
jgi:hypothetical protein